MGIEHRFYSSNVQLRQLGEERILQQHGLLALSEVNYIK